MRRRPSRQKSVSSRVLFGVNPVLETLRAAPETCETVWVVNDVAAAERVAAVARSLGVQVEAVARADLDRLTGAGHHQGVAVRTRPFAYVDLSDLRARRPALLVALDGITDPQNLGSIIRSAEVLGAGGLVLPRDRSAPVTPAAVRASAGASAHLPVAQVVNLARALGELKQDGYWIVGLDMAGSMQFQELPPLERAVLVVGSEGHGARTITLRGCDFVVGLATYGRVASLNAAVAAGIGLYALSSHLRLPPRDGSDS